MNFLRGVSPRRKFMPRCIFSIQIITISIASEQPLLVVATSAETYQVPVEGGLYVMTHSSTHDKKKMLDKISTRLGVKLIVEEI